MDASLDRERRELLLSQEQADAEREARIRAEAYRRNLADVVQTPAGYDVMFGILKSMGVERECAEDVRIIAVRNEGERLLNDIWKAAPREALQLVAALRSLNQ